MPDETMQTSPAGQTSGSSVPPPPPKSYVIWVGYSTPKYFPKDTEEDDSGVGYYEGVEFFEDDKPVRSKKKAKSGDSIKWYSDRPFTFLVEKAERWKILAAAPDTSAWGFVDDCRPWRAIKSKERSTAHHYVELEFIPNDGAEETLRYFVAWHHLIILTSVAELDERVITARPSVRASIVLVS